MTGYVVKTVDAETGAENFVPVVYWDWRGQGRIIGMVASPESFPWLADPPAGSVGYEPAPAAPVATRETDTDRPQVEPQRKHR